MKLPFLLCVLVFLSGCAGLRHAALRPVPEVIPARWETNSVPVLVTNRVADPMTAEVREVVAVSLEPVVTYTPPTVVTNWTPKTEAVAGVQAVGSLVPGWGTVAAYGASAVLTLWCGWLNRRNKKVSESLVMGIEDARKTVLASGNPELDAKILDLLKRHQAADGVGPAVAQLVDRLTGFTRTG